MFKRGCITIIQKKDVYSLFSVLFYSIAGYGCGHLNERLNRETLSLSLGKFPKRRKYFQKSRSRGVLPENISIKYIWADDIVEVIINIGQYIERSEM